MSVANANRSLPRALAVLLGLLAVVSSATAAVDIDGSYRNRKLGIKIVLPEGWRLTEQTGYPALLARITFKKINVMLSFGSLATQHSVKRPKTLEAFVAQNRAALAAVGLTINAARLNSWGKLRGWEVTIAPVGKRSMEQIYIKRGNNILIWTISCPTSELKLARMEVARLIELSL